MGTTGCGDGNDDGDGRPGSARSASSVETATAAAQFGGIVIPDGVSVLEARSENGIDTLYRLALSTDPQGLDLLLDQSNFTTPLTTTFRVAETTVGGPPLETSPSLLQGRDTYHRPDGRSVHRIVIVDERSAAERFVHIQLFTT